MKLICKTNSVYIDKYTYFNESVLSYGNLDYLTINKVYESIDFYISGTMTESNAYSIICDDGLERKLIANRFVTLEVHREQMLNKILK